MSKKPRLSFWQIWNMSFGFLGIQFGWGLQMANMSAIYQFLGADEKDIPILWLAAPLTGLIMQPIIGYYSDRTWTRLGRRHPYFLAGAVLASLALIAMPNSSSLWMAAGLLWILDASVNISMEPFRAFVGDMLPKEQRKSGFAMQSLLIGLGAVLSSAMKQLSVVQFFTWLALFSMWIYFVPAVGKGVFGGMPLGLHDATAKARLEKEPQWLAPGAALARAYEAKKSELANEAKAAQSPKPWYGALQQMLGLAPADPDPGERIDSPILETLIRETIIATELATAKEAKSPLVQSFNLAFATHQAVPEISKLAVASLATLLVSDESETEASLEP